MSSQPSGSHILAITDLGPASTNAVWRAALLAREHGVALKLLHACSNQKRRDQAHQLLAEIGNKVHARLGIQMTVEVFEGDLLPGAIAAVRAAGLLVIGPRGVNPLRDWISGTQAERLIRLCRVPTLVVKRPSALGRTALPSTAIEPGRYGRVLVPVDLRKESVDQIASAMAFSRDPLTEVFHAVDSRREARARRHPNQPTASVMQVAHLRLIELIRSSGALDQGAVPAIGFGRAADCVLAKERATGAELVVIGKRRRGMLADFILGGVTQDVIARSHADVLVVPDAQQRA